MMASFIATLGVFGAQIIHAQYNCIMNGIYVPCEKLTEKTGALLGSGIIIFLIFGLIGLLATLFWIFMIVHAVKHDIESKAVWIILMVITGILGAIIYYFAVKRNFIESEIKTETTADNKNTL